MHHPGWPAGATFNVYLSGDSGPVVLCLHGGGYTGLTWAPFATALQAACVGYARAGTQRLFSRCCPANCARPVIKGLQCGVELGLLSPSHTPHRCRVVAPDLRGHGLTAAANESDFSAATLAADVVALWRAMFAGGGGGGATEAAGERQQQQPATVLVGHSMGGAVAVHAAALKGKRGWVVGGWVGGQ